ncbi:Bdr family repetitive protein [Borrelia miyamotoi]
MLAELLLKLTIKQKIVDTLSYRYYKNELTHKDIEYLKRF